MEGYGSGKERTEKERERCCLFGLVLRNDVATTLCSERHGVQVIGKWSKRRTVRVGNKPN